MRIVRGILTALLVGCAGADTQLWATSFQGDATSRQLLVLLAARRHGPTPEQLVASSRAGQPLPGVFGLGSPESVEYLVSERAKGAFLEKLREQPEHPRSHLERYVVLTYPPGTSVSAIKEALLGNPDVLYVEENRPFGLSAAPADPLFAPPTATLPSDGQWGSFRLNLPTAWDITPGHAYVGVVDTGIQTSHEDFQAFLWAGTGWTYEGGNFRPQFSKDYGYSTELFVDSNVDEAECQMPAAPPPIPDPSCPAGSGKVRPAEGGHGTHVAGILSATANNNRGVAGDCWNCSLMIGKAARLAFSPQNSGYFNAVDISRSGDAIRGLVDRGAQAINMSFGGSGSCAGSNFLSAFCLTLDYANRRDVLLVAASGNDGAAQIDFPARDPRVVAVGGIVPIPANGDVFWRTCNPATDFVTDFGRECPSNFGPEQELVAPARQVLSTFYRELPFSSLATSPGCAGGSSYRTCTGTSMSAPHVTAAAAIVRSVNPLLSQAEVRKLLTDHASQSSVRDVFMGYGIPDVAASAQAALGKAGGAPLANRLTPLFGLYSPGAEDHLHTSVPQMALAAIYDTVGLIYQPVGPAFQAIPSFRILVR